MPIFDADLTNTDLFGADLTNADLRGAILTNANMTLTNLRESLFDCKSLKTVEFPVNTSQIHIVESNNGSLKEVLSCQ